VAVGRAADLAAKVDVLEITVIRINIGELRMRSIKDWENRKAWRGDYDAFDARQQTVLRWMQNHARHQLTHYDGIIDQLVGSSR